MLYNKYIQEVIDLCIECDDEASGYHYLNPNYRVLLRDANLSPDIVSDFEQDWDVQLKTQELEVTRRNKLSDRSRFVIDWLFDIITFTIDPAMITEENELMKNMMDYMKLNHELKEREAEVERKEEIQEKKSNIVELMPGINFSKRGAK